MKKMQRTEKVRRTMVSGKSTGIKVIALAAATALMVGLFAGCSSSSSDTAATTMAPGGNISTGSLWDGNSGGVTASDSEQFQSGNNSPTTAAPAATEAAMGQLENQVAPSKSGNLPDSVMQNEPLYESESATNDRYDQDRARKQNGESYLDIRENSEQSTENSSLLTFSLKVDTASYNNTERYLNSGQLPPPNAVRTEEFINYFNYDTPMFFEDHPFSIYTEIGRSPLNNDRHLALVRVKSKELDTRELPPSNLTFLIDTSGSMDSYDKLPLLKDAFSLLVETLGENDRVSIVTYAGRSQIALNSANGSEQNKILRAINQLSAGGSTAGANGIMTAYELAEKNFIPGGNNRVILATDGDFNVGISSTAELEKLIATKRDSGVYLSVLGFGTGNIRDDIMETLSKHGNGNYAYIHSLDAARKVFVEELAANLFVIADDVKAQVEFNPNNVKSYRLIGYENRMLNNEDFEDDRKDASEVGVGTDVIMMFELELTGAQATQDAPPTTLKYQNAESVDHQRPAALLVNQPDTRSNRRSDDPFAEELFEVRIRYKTPGESESKLMLHPATVGSILARNSSDFNFAASVVGFGQLLRNSSYARTYTLEDVVDLAKNNLGADKGGYRKAHIDLLGQYKRVR